MIVEGEWKVNGRCSEGSYRRERKEEDAAELPQLQGDGVRGGGGARGVEALRRLRHEEEGRVESERAHLREEVRVRVRVEVGVTCTAPTL